MSQVRCLELAVTLTAGAAEARVEIPYGRPERMTEIVDTFRRALENVRSEMGISHVRFPIRGRPSLELEMGEEVVVEDIEALIERIERIAGVVLEPENERDQPDPEAPDRETARHPSVPGAARGRVEEKRIERETSVEKAPGADSPLLACKSLAQTLQAMHDELASRSRKYRAIGGRIFHSRIGLLAPFRTLEELGEEAEPQVTRERIRQVSNNIVKWMHSDEIVGPFLKQLEKQLTIEITARAHLSPPDAVPAGPECPIACLRLESNEAGRGRSARREQDALKNFLASFLVDESGNPLFELETLSDGRAAIFRSADPAEIEALESELIELVKDQARQGLVRAGDILPEIDRRLERAPSASAERARVRFLNDLNWSGTPWTDDEAELVSRGTSVGAVLAAALAVSDKPMKKEALIESVMKEPWNLQQAKSSIGNEIFRLTADPSNRDSDEIFMPVFQLQRGQFGTIRHMSVDVTTLGDDADLVADLIVNGRKTPDPKLPYQWHCVDLVDELLEQGQCTWLEKVDQAQRWSLLDCLLRYHDPQPIANLTKAFWIARDPELPPEKHVKRNQSAIVRRVLESGKRMSSAQLKIEVERYQSLGANRQLQEPASPVVYRNGEWFLEGT